MKFLLIPEVIQTSSLDCGPAALKALLAGFGIRVSYDRLREACNTELDGTAIETVESVACEFGLDAEQIMLPLDHLLLPEASALPAIVVVAGAQGLTHFVVVWRRIGPWLQIMDPSVGRRWLHAKVFLQDVYQHTMAVEADAWLAYANSGEFQCPFNARLSALGIHSVATHSESWREMADRDAALRLTNSLVKTGALAKGRQAQQVFERFASQPELVPAHCRTVAQGDADEVLMRGAVLVRVKSRQSRPLGSAVPDSVSTASSISRLVIEAAGLVWPLLTVAVVAAATGAFVELLLFKALLDINANLALAGQRMAAAAAVIIFCAALLLLELPAFATGARIGRILEIRLRALFLEKLPKLSDHYFQSRSISDMAERSHILHRLRHLPDQLRQLILAASQLTITAAGIVWLEPRAWPFMLASLVAAMIPILSSHWLLAERDLRVRTHSGGLMRFYLDAMLGLMPLRTHGAAASLSRQHGALLSEWTTASLRFQRAAMLTEAVELFIMFAMAGALLLVHPFSSVQVGHVLLMAYWALNMPALGQEIATITRQYPNYRSIAMRLLEPLSAPEEPAIPGVKALQLPLSIDFKDVQVVASGNPILTDVCFSIEAGSHVAIVGPSGAGKSTLVGLLLGWLNPSGGEILVNGEPLNLEQLRLSTAWVDPAVQIWNRSLQANLSYGGDRHTGTADVIDSADLRSVLEGLPQGLQTKLGENGGLVSGGEGQRVRFGRALGRTDARLVILDEPFRGLDRSKRHELLTRARAHWPTATLLCITHDLSETRDFDRVLVIERGLLVENDSPLKLAADPESRYSQMLLCEEQARRQSWESDQWRRIRLQSGTVFEESPVPVIAERTGELA